MYGYWPFVAGIVLGALGLVLFSVAAPWLTLREFGYVFAAVDVIALYIVGLALAAAGAVIAPPLTGRQQAYGRTHEAAECADAEHAE